MRLAFGDQGRLGTSVARYQSMRRRRGHVVAWVNLLGLSSLTTWVEVTLSLIALHLKLL
jgi:hypothetical protein